jgi:four helix bundle suffix protein
MLDVSGPMKGQPPEERLAREELIPSHGGYRKLKSFQIAQLCYDVTVRFCDRYISPRSRTHDQMVQAARSGVQNIAEGSQASGTSKKTELKLTNVARASLEELRLDYEDFLRQRGLALWAEGDPRRKALVARRCASADAVASWVREVHGRRGRNGPDGRNGPNGPGDVDGAGAVGAKGASMGSMKSIKSTRATYAEPAANAALILIGVACALLDRQIAAQAAAFTEDGGFTERLYRVRSERRKQGPR